MNSDLKTVFVLGAGFTKAFLPEAPLLTDNYDVKEDKIKNLPHAWRVLELELRRNFNREINIERLMTRLDGQMPYDFEHGAKEELDLLLYEVKQSFRRKLDNAKTYEFHEAELEKFADYCIFHNINCITFNYDDVLDKALWKCHEVYETSNSNVYWHPDGGYGFFCRPSESCILDPRRCKDKTSMLLLKLHGSVNWRVRRGSSQPYSIDKIVHDEPWLSSNRSSKPDTNDIELHLEPEPFIVPPVLVKSVLVEQPILRLIWSLAYSKLKEAKRIVFIGYSLPVTDIAADFLFSEAIQSDCEISVVNLAHDEDEKEQIRNVYRKVFPRIADDQFDFRNALDWSCEIVGK